MNGGWLNASCRLLVTGMTMLGETYTLRTYTTIHKYTLIHTYTHILILLYTSIPSHTQSYTVTHIHTHTYLYTFITSYAFIHHHTIIHSPRYHCFLSHQACFEQVESPHIPHIMAPPTGHTSPGLTSFLRSISSEPDETSIELFIA
jgi:hypothetical protein